MLSGSTLLRVVVLFVVAAGLAGLVQAYWTYGSEPDPAVPIVQRTEPSRPIPTAARDATKPDASKPDISRADTAVPEQRAELPSQPAQGDAVQPILPPSPIRPLSRPALPPAGTDAPTNSALGRPAPLAASPPLRPATDDTAPRAEPGESAADASDSAGPRAVAVVDLNAGSLAELNGLKGGGLIGRAIVQRRPYTSVDQLLSKRVLSRSTYERIKDQVTVR